MTRKYRVEFVAHVYATVEVDARDDDEARDLADQLLPRWPVQVQPAAAGVDSAQVSKDWEVSDVTDGGPVDYPRVTAQGGLEWACCVSTIGPPCHHRELQAEAAAQGRWIVHDARRQRRPRPPAADEHRAGGS